MGNELSSISNVIPPANGNAIGDIEEELETAKNVNNMKVETLVSENKSEILMKKTELTLSHLNNFPDSKA